MNALSPIVTPGITVVFAPSVIGDAQSFAPERGRRERRQQEKREDPASEVPGDEAGAKEGDQSGPLRHQDDRRGKNEERSRQGGQAMKVSFLFPLTVGRMLQLFSTHQAYGETHPPN